MNKFVTTGKKPVSTPNLKVEKSKQHQSSQLHLQQQQQHLQQQQRQQQHLQHQHLQQQQQQQQQQQYNVDAPYYFLQLQQQQKQQQQQQYLQHRQQHRFNNNKTLATKQLSNVNNQPKNANGDGEPQFRNCQFHSKPSSKLKQQLQRVQDNSNDKNDRKKDQNVKISVVYKTRIKDDAKKVSNNFHNEESFRRLSNKKVENNYSNPDSYNKSNNLGNIGNYNHEDNQLKNFDELSETDSGIASNGTISEVQTPDPNDLITPPLFDDANSSNKNFNSIGNVSPIIGSNNIDQSNCHLTNGVSIIFEYDDISCGESSHQFNCSTPSSMFETLNTTLTKDASNASIKTICAEEVREEKFPKINENHLLNQKPNFADLNADICKIGSSNAEKKFHNYNSLSEINRNNDIKFSDKNPKILTSSLSVQENKPNRYEKSSYSSLNYLPRPVNVLSPSYERIMKFKERQNYSKTIDVNSQMSISDTTGNNFLAKLKIFPVFENESISETSFMENIQQTSPTVNTTGSKKLFKSVLSGNNIFRTSKPKKLPASYAVNYDSSINVNDRPSSQSTNNLSKTNSAISLRSDLPASNDNSSQKTNSMSRQNSSGFFNSLTRFFRRKSKLNESFDQQNHNTTLPLEKLKINKKKDINNNNIIQTQNLKNYNSDSNLVSILSKRPNQNLNESFYDDDNSNLPLTSQFVLSVAQKYQGARTLKQSLVDFRRWNSLLIKFAKIEPPNRILKAESFQTERSTFKKSIRTFMVDAKEVIVNHDSLGSSSFIQKVGLSCCTSYASAVACCCSVLDYISLGQDRQIMAEMLCLVGKTFFVVVSLSPSYNNQLKNSKPSPEYFEKINLLFERSKNLAVHVEALRYAGVTRLL